MMKDKNAFTEMYWLKQTEKYFSICGIIIFSSQRTSNNFINIDMISLHL